MKKQLSVRVVDALSPPAHDRLEVVDTVTRGLVVRVTSRGVKTFSFLYRSPDSGRQRRVTLGRWPDAREARVEALREARQRALSLAAEVAAGRDPLAARSSSRGETVATLARRFIEVEARPSVKTWRQAERCFENHLLPRLGARLYKDVRREELYAVLDDLVAAGKVGAAIEVRKHVGRLFSWALDRGYVTSSPAQRLRHRALDRKREVGRELSDNELRAVWLGAEALGAPWCQCFRVILLTGARRSEISEARWSELDERRRLLLVPAARYKTGREHSIPLSGLAWDLMQSCPRYGDVDDPFVFSVRSGSSPIRGFARMKARLDEEAAIVLGRKLPRYRVHDLRVTCRTRLAMLGVPGEVAEAVLGHAKQGIVGVYNKYRYLEEKRAALAQYGEHVSALMTGEGRGQQETG